MMKPHDRRFRVGLAVAVCASLAGCSGNSVPTSASTATTAEATVSGTVTVLGKPAKLGEVVFDPANVNRKSAATRLTPIDKDGHYEITTLVGLNSVSVRGKGISDNPKVGYVSRSFDVRSGTNTFNIELP